MTITDPETHAEEAVKKLGDALRETQRKLEKAERELARRLRPNEGQVEVLFVGGPRDSIRQVFPEFLGHRYNVCGMFWDAPGVENRTIRQGSYRIERCTYEGAAPRSYLGWWEGWQ